MHKNVMGLTKLGCDPFYPRLFLCSTNVFFLSILLMGIIKNYVLLTMLKLLQITID